MQSIDMSGQDLTPVIPTAPVVTPRATARPADPRPSPAKRTVTDAFEAQASGHVDRNAVIKQKLFEMRFPNLSKVPQAELDDYNSFFM